MLVLILPADRAGVLVYARNLRPFWVGDLATLLRLLEVLL